MKVYGLKIVRWLLRVALGLLLLIVLISVLIQLPFVQTFLINTIADGFSRRTGTEIAIQRVAVLLPGTISLKDVYLEDQTGDTLLYAGKIGVKLRLRPLMRNHLHVRNVSLKNIHAKIRRAEPDTVFNYGFLVHSFASGNSIETKNENSFSEDVLLIMADTTSGNGNQMPSWRFSLDAFTLKDVRLHFFDYLDGVDLNLALSYLSTGMDQLDPSLALFHFGNTELKDLYVSLNINEPAAPRPEKEPSPDLFPNIDLAMQRLDFRGISVDVAIDNGDPEIYDLDVLAENLLLRKDTAGLDLVSLKAGMMDVVDISKMSAHLAVGKNIVLKDLDLETSDSHLQANIFVGASLDELMDMLSPPENIMPGLSMELGLSHMLIGKDLAGLLPGHPILNDVFAQHDALHIKGQVRGKLDNLCLENLDIEVPGLLELAIDGEISGLPDTGNARFTFPAIRLAVTTESWNNIALLSDFAEQYQLPERLEALVHFDGTYRDFKTDLSVSSGFGGLQINASYRDLPGKLAAYSSHIALDQLMIGEIMGLEILREGVSGVFDVEGSGLSAETMDVDFGLIIHKATLNNYDYKDLALRGKVLNELSTLEASYHDENLSFSLLGELRLNDPNPLIKSSIDLLHMDGRALYLTEDTFLLKTSLRADLRLTSNDFFDGMVLLKNTDLLFGDQNYTLDSLLIMATYHDEESDLAGQSLTDPGYMLEVYSALLTASYRGNIPPQNIQSALGNHINSYFGKTAETTIDSLSHEKFDVSFTVYPSDWFTGVFFAGLESFDTFTFDASFDAGTGLLNLKGLMPEVVYGGIGINGLEIHSETDLKKASLMAGLEGLHVSGLEFNQLSLEAVLEDNRVLLSIAADKESVQQADKESDQQADKESDQQADKESDREADNEMDNEAEKKSNKPWLVARGDLDELEVLFMNADLGKIFSQDAIYPLSGIIDGNIIAYDLTGELSFTADLSVNKFGYSDDTFGDVTLHVNSTDLSSYTFNASVMNFGNQLEASGQYTVNDEAALDMLMVVRRLDLSSLEVFLSEEIKEPEGSLVGDVRVWGQVSSLDYLGSITFKDARFLASFVNVYYSMPDETIHFERDKVNFRNFSLLDSQGRRATLSGTVNTADFLNPIFDLVFTSENFLALQLDPGQNEMLSGRALINSNLRLRGDLQRPVIDGSLKLNEGTSFVMNLPQTVPEAIGDEGIVVFLSPDAEDTPSQATAPGTLSSPFSNLDVSINVEVDPMTNVRINIDEYAGDYLSIRGGGMISYGTDPGGRISLSGRYELAEGTYLLTFYDVLSRQFGIVRGSNIMWAGDPANPNVDIRAVYNIRTSARELFATASGVSDMSEPALRQTFPFQVFLEMKGPLNTSQISFRIGLPPDQQHVLDGRLQARLNELSQNESELNKQVFALLTIGSFIPENPLEAGPEGPGISSAARSSASRLLTQQLNRLSDQYVRGVDINFDIESFQDATESGYRGTTQLNLEVSKNFFDERLRFTVGGNIELEDETRRNTSAGDIAGDFTIEYMLTPSGTLVLKGFRKKEFDDMFEGQVIETGVSLLYNRTYNRLRELFGRKEEE